MKKFYALKVRLLKGRKEFVRGPQFADPCSRGFGLDPVATPLNVRDCWILVSSLMSSLIDMVFFCS